jgi:hypothetical protein
MLELRQKDWPLADDRDDTLDDGGARPHRKCQRKRETQTTEEPPGGFHARSL